MTLHTSAVPHADLATRTQRVRMLSLAFGAVLGMAAGAYLPQTVHAADKAAASPAAKTAAPAKKAPAKPPRKAALRKATETKLAPLPEATPEQFDAAKRAHLGRYECEFKKTVVVDRNDANPGYINLTLGTKVWVMKPVLSSTGAIRLEDVRGETLMLQILTKSMLMNVKTGQRMVDGCVHEVQRAAEEELRKNPRPPSFNLDGKPAEPAPAAP